MPQFSFKTVICQREDEDAFDRCYARCKEYGYDISVIKETKEEQIRAVEGWFKNYRNSSDRNYADFNIFLSHYKVWRKAREDGETYLIIESDAYQTIDIPGNIDQLYTEVLNLSAGDWEFENGIVDVPSSKVQLNQDDDYINYKKHSLKNANAYLIKPEASKRACDIVRKQGYMIPRVMLNSLLFDVKMFRRKLFV